MDDVCCCCKTYTPHKKYWSVPCDFDLSLFAEENRGFCYSKIAQLHIISIINAKLNIMGRLKVSLEIGKW